MWPFRKKPSCFPIGRYTLDMPVAPSPGLRELSASEYATITRMFENETIFHAATAVFLGRPWSIDLGTVSGRVYKVAAYLECSSKEEANPIAMETLMYCTQRLGKPAQRETGLFVWDTEEGNVILQTAETAEGLAINLFETSHVVRQFTRRASDTARQ